jgi:hypothetical protein
MMFGMVTRYGYLIQGKGRWMSMTLKKPKKKGGGAKKKDKRMIVHERDEREEEEEDVGGDEAQLEYEVPSLRSNVRLTYSRSRCLERKRNPNYSRNPS